MARHHDQRNVLAALERLVEQRAGDAAAAVGLLRAEHPAADPDELADLLIRRCVRDLTVSGAMSGGAAASPLAGSALAAAGADSIYGVGRLSEMVMAIGIAYGRTEATTGERAGWVLAALGLSEAGAMGVTGLAAKVGARGGARLVAKLPAASGAGGAAAGVAAGAARRGAVGAASRRAVARMASGRGPWSLAALLPYGIGAGVGAAGNALVARSVGVTAKQYFRDRPGGTAAPGSAADDPVVDAEVIDVEVIDAEVIDAEVIDVEVIDVEVIEETLWNPAADDDVVDAEIVEPGPSAGDAPSR
jgi:hypothetical protein